MHIVYFVLSVAFFLGAVFASLSTGGVVFMILMSMLFLMIGAWTLLSSRLQSSRRPERHMISPDELRQYREQAEKLKQQKQQNQDQVQ
jgi:ABC-type lipoprotein release transport system permease subunit